MKRGLALPLVHSALATTRRGRLQLSRVDQSKTLKRRAGLSAARLSARASTSSSLIFATSRRLRASPKTYSTRFSSHQLIRSSRQKPESALSPMPTLGQRARIHNAAARAYDCDHVGGG